MKKMKWLAFNFNLALISHNLNKIKPNKLFKESKRNI